VVLVKRESTLRVTAGVTSSNQASGALGSVRQSQSQAHHSRLHATHLLTSCFIGVPAPQVFLRACKSGCAPGSLASGPLLPRGSPSPAPRKLSLAKQSGSGCLPWLRWHLPIHQVRQKYRLKWRSRLFMHSRIRGLAVAFFGKESIERVKGRQQRFQCHVHC